MPFTVSPMFPGDLYDTMDHMGAAGTTTTQASSPAGNASAKSRAFWLNLSSRQTARPTAGRTHCQYR